MNGRAVIGLSILLACCHCALALNPSLSIDQYAHNAWTVREGFFKGVVNAIAQTPDGYLWLGTEFGLQRFDGVRSVSWQPPAGQYLPGAYIRCLLAARDGSLWIGTNEGLSSWKDGKLTHYAELAGPAVHTLLEDREGTIWVGGGSPTGRLCAIRSGGVRCYGEDGSFGVAVISAYDDSAGNLWAGGTTGLWRWKPGPPKLYPLSGPVPEIYSMIEGDEGTLLLAMRGGIRRLAGGRVEAFPLPGVGQQFTPVKLLRDRNGGLWIGTSDRGLLHMYQGKTDRFTHADGLSGDRILSLLQDREGNVWIATSDGIDRFRDFAVTTISVKQGLSSASVGSVLAARDGSVWLGTHNGLNSWKDGEITIYRRGSAPRAGRDLPNRRETVHEITAPGLPDNAVESLFQDDRGRIWVSTRRGIAYRENGRFVPVGALPGGEAHSVEGDSAGNLWISDQERGLVHLLRDKVVERIPFAGLEHKDWADTLLADPVRGGLWLGFLKGGVSYFRDGLLRASYASADGLGVGVVGGLHLDRDGTLWAATDGGLSRVKSGRVATLTSQNGLPCDSVKWVLEDDARSFWLGMACGLVRVARSELDAWAASPKRTVRATVFDSSDGVVSHSVASGYSPRAAKSADGKLWFLPFDGVSVVDPAHLPFNRLAPPVHIEQVTADRRTWDASSHMRLPPLVRDLEIDYTALSLVAPEKVFFRVKLEGWDRDWVDIGNRRQKFYSDLPPRNYRFRVVACNNSGVWNEAGASLDFSIAPAYYQTRWFQASGLAAFVLLLWALYRLRLRQIAYEFDMRLDERVNERTRIARELHDTLLQNLHGLMFRFQAARNMLPRRSDEAIQALDGALITAERAIDESRNAIQGLRSGPLAHSDLAEFLTALGLELADSQDANRDSVSFSVTVEGERPAMSPALHDEVCLIACEALRNAFRHAHARRIEAEIRYDDRLLRLRIRDDGRGIDPKVLKQGGSTGHWGLPGIRERAKRIGAELDFWSEAGAGTEVELTIPASVAYGTSRAGSGFRLFRKMGVARARRS